MKRLFGILLLCLLAVFARAEMKPNFIDYLLSDDRYEQVVRIATRELERHPKDGRLYTQRATAYLQLNELSLAVNDLSSAIRYYKTADKSRADLYRMRGVLYEYLEQPKMALRDYSRLIRLCPDSPEGYQLRGDLYMEIGQPSKAKKDYEKQKLYEKN